MKFTQIKLSSETSKWLSRILDADVEYINVRDDNIEVRYIFSQYIKALLEVKPLVYNNTARKVRYDKKEKLLEIYPETRRYETK